MKRGAVAALLVVVLGACSATDEGGGADGGGFGGGNDGGSGGIGGSGGTGDGGTGGVGGTGGTGGTGGVEPVTIDWETCYLESGRAECATLDMPLDRDDPASPTIPFFVRRIKAQGESRGQLWLLEGGPGVNGGQLGYYADSFLLDLGLDIYMPDYRGVGRSGDLNCNGRTDPTSLCLAELENEFGEDLVRFSTSDAVRDVGDAIQLLRKPGEQVFVWGTSYGTVTAHRFLHLFPDLANGVVLDSSCGAAGCDFANAGVDMNQNASDIANLCAADPFCTSKLGSDPWSQVADVLDRVEAGYCAAGVPSSIRPWVRALFAQLMGPMYMPSVGMALIYRLDRCNAADAAGIQNFFSIFLGGGSGWVIQDEVEQSELLYYNIVLNEFWDPSVTLAELEAIEADLVATTGAVLYFPDVEEMWPWPRYEVPADLRTWADVDVPVLILNGTLDAQTRHERMIDARDAFVGPNQHVVIVPYGTHGVFLGSAPTAADPDHTCGAAITRQFLRAPTASLDTSCLAEQAPPRFDTADYQSYWFGTPDLYENVSSAKPAIQEIDDPLVKAKIARARAELQRPHR